MKPTRRAFLSLGALAVSAAVTRPAVARPAVARPRCDADTVEALWAAGVAVMGLGLVLRRPLVMPDHAILENCRLTWPDGGTTAGLRVVGDRGGGRIVGNVFMVDPVATPSGLRIAPVDSHAFSLSA